MNTYLTFLSIVLENTTYMNSTPMLLYDRHIGTRKTYDHLICLVIILNIFVKA